MPETRTTDENPLLAGNGAELPPAPATHEIANVITGDYRKDSLLEDLDYRWNFSTAPGSSVSVTYSFAQDGPDYADASDLNGFQPFTAEQQTAVSHILATLSKQVGIDFTEVSDSASSYGMLRFGDNIQSDSSGYAYMPNTTGENSGDVYISVEYSTGVTPGTFGYATLVHEIGHAIGLKHPGNYNAGEQSVATAGNYLGVQDDKTILTIMSYRESSQELQGDWYAPYDMLTLRYLYGTRSYNDTDTTYTLTDANGQKLNSIVDDGGTDTINLSALSSGATLDLNPGSVSSLGKISTGEAAIQNLAIATDAMIENVLGSAHADIITLNSASNRVDAGGGIDTAVYNGNYSLHTLVNNGTGYAVSGGNNVTDLLINIERLKFADKSLALDLHGNAGMVAKVLGAVFGKDSVSTSAYVGIGLNLLDGGMSYQDLVQLALNSRLGEGFSNSAEVDLLYLNLLGSLPSDADRSFWADAMTAGQYTPASLGILAADLELNASNINLVGLADTGLAYT